MATIVNQSRFIVRVKRRPGLDREFPYTRAAAAKIYRNQVLRENPNLKAEADVIERGRTHFLVRILRRGLAVDTRLARRTTLAERMQVYIHTVCPTHKGEDLKRIRRQPRAHLERLHCPLASITSAHMGQFKQARDSSEARNGRLRSADPPCFRVGDSGGDHGVQR